MYIKFYKIQAKSVFTGVVFLFLSLGAGVFAQDNPAVSEAQGMGTSFINQFGTQNTMQSGLIEPMTGESSFVSSQDSYDADISPVHDTVFVLSVTRYGDTVSEIRTDADFDFSGNFDTYTFAEPVSVVCDDVVMVRNVSDDVYYRLDYMPDISFTQYPELTPLGAMPLKNCVCLDCDGNSIAQSDFGRVADKISTVFFRKMKEKFPLVTVTMSDISITGDTAKVTFYGSDTRHTSPPDSRNDIFGLIESRVSQSDSFDLGGEVSTATEIRSSAEKDEDGVVSYNDYDPNSDSVVERKFDFDKNRYDAVPGCQPACKVAKNIPYKDTDYINYKKKGITAGGYRDTTDSSATVSRNCIPEENRADVYFCPVRSDESVVKDCSCDKEFGKAAAIIDLLDEAAEDMICSDGKKRSEQ